jgi:hypothetical protein
MAALCLLRANPHPLYYIIHEHDPVGVAPTQRALVDLVPFPKLQEPSLEPMLRRPNPAILAMA